MAEFRRAGPMMLRERVAREVHAIWRDGFNEETRAIETWEANEVFHDEFYADADRILAVLGLDDPDAAAERMWDVLAKGGTAPEREPMPEDIAAGWRAEFRAALDAALTGESR